MGIAVGDVENDGDWDVYITDTFGQAFDALPKGNPLYLGNGNGTFQDNSAPAAGVAGSSSWPTNFFDADDDGDEDLFMGAFGVVSPLNLFWVNDGAGSFTDVSAASGVQSPFKHAYGSAVLDYDRDGDLDLVVNNGGFQKMLLLRNDSPDGNHWLGVKLVATVSNRSAIGTVVKARVGSQTMMRQVLGGSSAHSQDELVPHFGLGSATVVDSLEVFWPSGLVTHLSNVAADQYLTVTEQPQHFAAVGQASSGGGAYAPSLILSGEATPGGSIAVDIATAQGGGLVFLIVGLPVAPPLNLKGCALHVMPLVIVPAGATTAGPNGQGNYHLPAQIPVSATPVTAGLQAFVTSASLPGNESATNAVTLTILP
ncbi:MAG: CRTAC1 family protein, partial [Planctomycetes bacterium]|nr:CRTAC1 family protein [Planctomycetota bacterium]